MKRILAYMTKSYYEVSTDSTTYIERIVKRQYSNEFEFDISFDPDPTLAMNYDIVFCRFEIPLNTPFLEDLRRYDDGTRLFINPPATKLLKTDKIYLRELSHLLPPTIITSDPSEIVDFVKSISTDAVIKPTDTNHGIGIERIESSASNDELCEVAHRRTECGNRQMVVQQYVDVPSYGDKRINLIFGEPISAYIRFPPKGSFIANYSAGGSWHQSTVTDNDRRICDAIRSYVRKYRIAWGGVDVIGPYLGEINIASPGGLVVADEFNGNDLGITYLIDRLREWRSGH